MTEFGLVKIQASPWANPDDEAISYDLMKCWEPYDPWNSYGMNEHPTSRDMSVVQNSEVQKDKTC